VTITACVVKTDAILYELEGIMNCVRGKRKERQKGVCVMSTAACSLRNTPLINRVKNI
jgi:hypothetical protein